ncbi:MAG: hypothetical protein JKY31_05955 [Rhodobacteraceae bacterium]|nr:hypothetical protein [Paracoccaceae bacterium]
MTQDFLVTGNAEAAEICARLEAGESSPELTDAFQAAMQNNAYWWIADIPDSSNYIGNEFESAPVYISAKYVSFVSEATLQELNRQNSLDSVLGGLTYSTRWAPARILEISGQGTENAYAMARPIARDVWNTCHYGFNLSGLYQAFHRSDGDLVETISASELARLLSSSLEAGIWTGCRDYYGENGEFGDYLAAFEAEADCSAGVVDGYSVDANMLKSVGSTAAGGIPERFITLCPSTAAELLDSHCLPNEDIVFACKINGQAERVSICQSGDRLTYIFGRFGETPELEFSANTDVTEFQQEYPHSFVRMANGNFIYEAVEIDGFSGVNVYQATLPLSPVAASIATLQCENNQSSGSLYITED